MGKSYSQKVKSRSRSDDRPKRARNIRGAKDQKAPFPWAPVIVVGIVIALIIGAVAYYQIQDQVGDEGDNSSDNNNGGSNNGNGESYPYLSIPLESTDSGIIKLSDHSGKVVIVDMFATWCPPCREMMGILEELRTMFSPNEVVILSIDTDLTETLSQVSDFKDEYQADWTFAMSTQQFNGYFPAESIPTLYVLDGTGKQVETHVGAGVTAGELAALISPHMSPV
ncbi:MAG: TlpA family protein disulfide reductase [Thermoplasmatota archaeon]